MEEGFPKSFLAGIFPFILTYTILLTSAMTGTFPNVVIFYFSIFVSVIISAGLVGFNRFFDALGFDVTQPGETISKVWWRYPIYIGLGFIIGYFCYRILAKGLNLAIFPLDFALSLSLQTIPLYLSVLNWLIVALGEEILRTYGMFTFGNWFESKFKLHPQTALSLGIIVSSIAFILLHTIAWSTSANLMNYLVGALISILFTSVGFILYHKQIFGKLAFLEFSIIPGVVAHFIFDTMVDLQMRVLPPLMCLAFI